MWAIFGSRSEYEETPVEVAERHRALWQARQNATRRQQEKDTAKTAEAEHDADIGW